MGSRPVIPNDVRDLRKFLPGGGEMTIRELSVLGAIIFLKLVLFNNCLVSN